MTKSKISIIGCGAFGTAISVYLARKGYPCMAWTRNYSLYQSLTHQHKHPKFPQEVIPINIHYTTHLNSALYASNLIIIAVSSAGLHPVCMHIQPLKHIAHRFCFLNKGIVNNQYSFQYMQHANMPYAYLSAVGFAQDIIRGMLFDMVVASPNHHLNTMLYDIFSSKKCLVQINTDIIGVSGVMKNVLSIGCGIIDAMGASTNQQYRFLAAGFQEICQLGASMHAQTSTFLYACGLNDCLITCLLNKSRNRRFGQEIGNGLSLIDAQNNIGTIEGIQGSLFLFPYTKKGRYPILHTICRIVQEKIPPYTLKKFL